MLDIFQKQARQKIMDEKLKERREHKWQQNMFENIRELEKQGINIHEIRSKRGAK